MFDVIFDNIFILIPVALILVFRVIRPRLKQRESQEPEKQEQHPFFIERELEENDANLGHWEEEKKAVKSVPKKNYISRKHLKPAVSTLSEDILNTQVPLKKETVKIPSSNVLTTDSFPKNLEYLPPIKRAFVFSEIFSQPKGFI